MRSVCTTTRWRAATKSSAAGTADLAADGCTIAGNRISVDSWAVNGGGVLGFRTKGVRVTDNEIEGTGYHCTGVAATSEGCQDIHVADNKITMREGAVAACRGRGATVDVGWLSRHPLQR